MFKVSLASLQTFDTRLTLTPSVIPNSNYVIMISDSSCLKYFCVFLYCNHQVHRDFLITMYKNWRYSPTYSQSGHLMEVIYQFHSSAV
jgi:hypothetical protein